MAEKCEVCGGEATLNWQKCWVRWEYDAQWDNYSERDVYCDGPEPEHFLCRECEGKWLDKVAKEEGVGQSGA